MSHMWMIFSSNSTIYIYILDKRKINPTVTNKSNNVKNKVFREWIYLKLNILLTKNVQFFKDKSQGNINEK